MKYVVDLPRHFRDVNHHEHIPGTGCEQRSVRL